PSDFPPIGVGDDAGKLVLPRLAVGDHLLLGGDNMDLTLAHFVAQALGKSGTKLDAGQMLQLTHAARQAKEQLLTDAKLDSAPVTVLGKGRSVVGGSVKYDLSRADVERVLVDGFFPECPRDATPATRAAGFQELGLPYVGDPAVTKHLAHFLSRQAEALKRGKKNVLPPAVLFNGGVFKAPILRDRLLKVLNAWAKETKADPVRSLAGADL